MAHLGPTTIKTTAPRSAARPSLRAWGDTRGPRLPRCGCTGYWQGKALDGQGRRIAADLRLAAPEAVADVPIDHFDDHETFDDLPREGRDVADDRFWQRAPLRTSRWTRFALFSQGVLAIVLRFIVPVSRCIATLERCPLRLQPIWIVHALPLNDDG